MNAYSKIDILRCLDGEEVDELLELLNSSKYTKVKLERDTIPGTDEVMSLEGEMPFGTSPKLEEWLQEKGVPFKRWTDMCDEFQAEIFVFDGARTATVFSDREGNALVDMRALRAVIDMLENDEEVRALVYANQQWVETDVSNMFRWRVEEEKEFSSMKKDDFIDVEVDGEE
jgi:hypothetical protein